MPNVLIVEDEIRIRHILEKIVMSAGYTPITAENGEEGVIKARAAIPELILTDIYMPKKTGLELCQELKFNRETCGIGIIVITAASDSPDLYHIFRYGANAWIKKPFRQSDVLDTMDRVRREVRLIRKQQIIENWIDFNLASTTDTLQSFNLFIENLISHSRLNPGEIKKLGFAVNEMLINSMEHGNHFDIQKAVGISYAVFNDRIVIKIQDEGSGFLLQNVPDPFENPEKTAIMREREGKRPGGYGIAVTGNYVDEMKYNDAGNVLLLTKYIRQE